MHIVAISDIHGQLPTIPPCDILIIAGDLCPDLARGHAPMERPRQMEWCSTVFAEWESRVPAGTILMTPGNHDWIQELPTSCRTKFLVDESIIVGGLTFYFTPWIPQIGHWNWMLPRQERRERFEQIPHNVDVLVTHTPAYGVTDRNYTGERCGCPELLTVIRSRKPRHHIFGHIHEGQRDGVTTLLPPTYHHCVSQWGIDWRPLELDIYPQVFYELS